MLLAALRLGTTVAIKYDSICIARQRLNMNVMMMRNGVSVKKGKPKAIPEASVAADTINE